MLRHHEGGGGAFLVAFTYSYHGETPRRIEEDGGLPGVGGNRLTSVADDFFLLPLEAGFDVVTGACLRVQTLPSVDNAATVEPSSHWCVYRENEKIK